MLNWVLNLRLQIFPVIQQLKIERGMLLICKIKDYKIVAKIRD